MAVANKASAMPGATTASVVSWRAAMAENEFMMPHTVPNRPIKGEDGANRREKAKLAFEAIHLAQDGDVHRFFDAVLDAGQQRFARRAAFKGAPPFAQGGNEHRRHRVIGALGRIAG